MLGLRIKIGFEFVSDNQAYIRSQVSPSNNSGLVLRCKGEMKILRSVGNFYRGFKTLLKIRELMKILHECESFKLFSVV